MIINAVRRPAGDEETDHASRQYWDTTAIEYQAEHGAFTDEEMAETSREMGLPWPPQPKEEKA